MPLYEYQCPKCGRFEVIQKYAEAPLTVCPTCRSDVQKLPSAPAIQFKGTGWYVTDYARKGEGKGKGEGAKSEGAKSEGAKSEGKGGKPKSEGAKDSGGKESAAKDTSSSSSSAKGSGGGTST